MSGLAAPSRIAMPTPTLAKSIPPSSLPDLPSAVSAAGDAITRSKLSPASMRLIMLPTVPVSHLTLRPDASNCGMTASSTCLKAPAVRTLSGSARAAPDKTTAIAKASATYLTLNMHARPIAPPWPLTSRLLRLVGALDGGDSRGGDLLILLRRCATAADAADDDAIDHDREPALKQQMAGGADRRT